MPGRLRHLLLLPRRYPFRCLLAAALLCVGGYYLWETTPAVRFRREFSAAQRALDAYDFADARRHIDECISLRPADSNLRLLAAQAARRDGDIVGAADHLAEYHKFFGEITSEERLEWSMQQAQLGKLALVDTFLLECLEVRHPASERIFESLALGCMHDYNLDLAIFWVRRALEKYPKNPVVRLVRFQTLGQREESIAPLRELVADYPRYLRARQQLADVLFAARMYDEAANEYERLQSQSPGKLMPLLNLARCRIKSGRTAEASHLLAQLKEEFSDSSEVLLECGRLALQEDRLAEAEDLLRRADRLAPNDHEVHLELGICLHRLKKEEESKWHIDKAKRIELDLSQLEKEFEAMVKNPIDPEPRLRAGQICLRNGQMDEGLRWLNGALERKPDHKPTHQALADYFESQGDTQQAEMHRRKAR